MLTIPSKLSCYFFFFPLSMSFFAAPVLLFLYFLILLRWHWCGHQFFFSSLILFFLSTMIAFSPLLCFLPIFFHGRCKVFSLPSYYFSFIPRAVDKANLDSSIVARLLFIWNQRLVLALLLSYV